jgi:hypothetical protein
MKTSKRWVVGLAAWSVFVWGTRIKNDWSDQHASTASKLGTTLLSLSFIVLAIAAVVIVRRARDRDWTPSEARVLRVFAGWTTTVWLVFGTLILVHHHPWAFKAVHVTLGLISIGLSVEVWRGARSPRSAERASGTPAAAG